MATDYTDSANLTQVKNKIRANQFHPYNPWPLKVCYNSSNPNSLKVFTGLEYQNNSKSSSCCSKSVFTS